MRSGSSRRSGLCRVRAETLLPRASRRFNFVLIAFVNVKALL